MSWLYALWFFLPAGVSNASPVLMKLVPGINKVLWPLDFGKNFRGKRIFGANKSIAGVLFGGIIAAFIGLGQSKIGLDGFPETSLLIGAALGFGALIGDAVESFFKRQRGINSGQKWFPFDQIDYIFGGILFALPFVDLTFVFCAQILITWFGMHLLFAYIGYKLGLKDSPI